MTPKSTPKPVSSMTPRPTSTRIPTPVVDPIVQAMTLEQKIGQIMTIGFDGPELDSGLREMIEQYHIGGINLFARNITSPDQLAQLNVEMQKLAMASGHPGLLIAVDQEGGRVARLTEDKGFTELPGAMAIAATGKPENAAKTANLLAAEMRAVGINVDYAPDLDVNNNPNNPVIGIRSFGSDPEMVIEYGLEFFQGLRSGAIIAVGKHFPGHGDTQVDSHVSMPLVAQDRLRLEEIEFAPFKAAVRAEIPVIMSAHVAFPAIEPNVNLPATLSGNIMTGLLREEFGFQGVIATDALEMGALGKSGFPVPLAAATALQAGADLLLFNRDHAVQKEAFILIREWVSTGKIPLSRLDDAVRHILILKAQYRILKPELTDPSSLSVLVGTAAHQKVAYDLASQSITLLRDQDRLLPLSAEDRVVVVEPPAARGLGRLLSASFYEVAEKPTKKDIEMVMNMTFNLPKVIIATSDAILNPSQVELIKSVQKTGVPVIVVALRGPYDLMAFPDVGTYLATYGSPPPTLRALADALLGKFMPSGRLPVALPGLYELRAGMQGYDPSSTPRRPEVPAPR